jgi:hypothetical protein
MLREAVRVLQPGGELVLVFPNYDNPLRRCPSYWCARGDDDSLRSAFQPFRPGRVLQQTYRRTAYFVRQAIRQFRLTLSSTYQQFWVNEDPAINHLPWSRDRDAIHIVSGQSVERFLEAQGMQITYSSCRVWTGLPIIDGFLDGSAEYVIRARHIQARA